MNITITNTNAIVADLDINAAYARAVEMQRQIKALTKMLDAEKTVIKSAMGDALELVDVNGLELATYKFNKDSERVDSKRLMNEYPEVYNQVVELVSGSRVFLIK
jgi:predicted phage-related endonuclease